MVGVEYRLVEDWMVINNRGYNRCRWFPSDTQAKCFTFGPAITYYGLSTIKRKERNHIWSTG